MALHIKVERLPFGETFVRVQPWSGNYARLTPQQARERAGALERAADEAEVEGATVSCSCITMGSRDCRIHGHLARAT